MYLQSGIVFYQHVLDRVPSFVPASSNNHKFPELTFDSINNFPTQIIQLLQELQGRFRFNPKIMVDTEVLDIAVLPESKLLTQDLVRTVFNKFSCSKTEFSPAYSYILGKLTNIDELKILEIGIGSNDSKLISSMPRNYMPGASLKSYAELLPNSNCFGVDVDRNILFSEPRIQTAFADQTQLQTLLDIPEIFNQKTFDLIIDDGLHSTEANLNTLIFSVIHTSDGGLIYIEDVSKNSVEIWKLVALLFNQFGISAKIYNQDSFGLSVLIEIP